MTRYAQCTTDCTTDCGACKGAGRPAAREVSACSPHCDPDQGGGHWHHIDTEHMVWAGYPRRLPRPAAPDATRVAQVADAHGWQLDAAGVLPREQRPAVVPGQPIPAVGSGLAEARPTAPLAPLPHIPAQRTARPTPTCSRPGCDNQVKVKSLGLCAKHYMQTRRAAAAS